MSELPQDIWQSLLESTPNIIVVVDRKGTILYLNRGMPGTNKDEAVGLSQYNFIETEHHETVRRAIEKVFATGESETYEIRGSSIDGGIGWYSTSVGPIVRNGEIVAVSLFTLDVTARRSAEENLKKAQQELLSKQSQALLELSTPVIQIWDEILVLPLIGTVDTVRAQQIVENLLDSIVRTQASVAIIDITGVPVVDTKVANNFLKTIEAARMLGTEVILTGASPYNAQTLVKLGVDLSNITTKGSLQAGLKLAFHKTKNRVIKEN